MRQILYPFAADSAERDSLPYSRPLPGQVAYNTGYTVDYQLQLSIDPNAKAIERKLMNGLFYDITENIRDYQRQGIPDWFQPTGKNPGQWPPYPRNAIVRRNGVNYISLADENSDPPGPGNPYWEKIELSSYILGQIPMRYGGSNSPSGDFNTRTSSETIAFSGSMNGWANRPSDYEGLFECFRIPANQQVIQRYTDVKGGSYWRSLSNAGWTSWYRSVSTMETNPYLKWNTRNDLAWDWEFDRGWDDYSGSAYINMNKNSDTNGLNTHVTATATDLGGAAATESYRGHWATVLMPAAYVNASPIYVPYIIETNAQWDGEVYLQTLGFDANGVNVETTAFAWTRDEKNWNLAPLVTTTEKGTFRGIARSTPFTNPAVTRFQIRFVFIKPTNGVINGNFSIRIGANQEYAYKAAARALIERLKTSGDTMTGLLRLDPMTSQEQILSRVQGHGWDQWRTGHGVLHLDSAAESTAYEALAWRHGATKKISIDGHWGGNNECIAFHMAGNSGGGLSHVFGNDYYRLNNRENTYYAQFQSDGNIIAGGFINGSLISDLNSIRGNWVKADGTVPMSDRLLVDANGSSRTMGLIVDKSFGGGYAEWSLLGGGMAINGSDLGSQAVTVSRVKGAPGTMSMLAHMPGGSPIWTFHATGHAGGSVGFTHRLRAGAIDVYHPTQDSYSILSHDGNVSGSIFYNGNLLNDLNQIRSGWIKADGTVPMSGILTSENSQCSLSAANIPDSSHSDWRTAPNAVHVRSGSGQNKIGIAWGSGGPLEPKYAAISAWDSGGGMISLHLSGVSSTTAYEFKPGHFAFRSSDAAGGAICSIQSDGNIVANGFVNGSLISDLNAIRSGWLSRSGGEMIGQITLANPSSPEQILSKVVGHGWDQWRTGKGVIHLDAAAPGKAYEALAWRNGSTKKIAIDGHWEGDNEYIAFHMDGQSSGLSHVFSNGRTTVYEKGGPNISIHSWDGNITGTIFPTGSLSGDLNEIRTNWLRRSGGNMSGRIALDFNPYDSTGQIQTASLAGYQGSNWRTAKGMNHIVNSGASNNFELASWSDGLKKKVSVDAWWDSTGERLTFRMDGQTSPDGVSHAFDNGSIQVFSKGGGTPAIMYYDGNISGTAWAESRTPSAGSPSDINQVMFRDRGTMLAAAQANGLPTGEVEWTVAQLMKLPSGMYQIAWDPNIGSVEKNSAIWLGMSANSVTNGTYPYGLVEIKHGSAFTVIMYYPHSAGGSSSTQVSVLYNCVYWGDTAAKITATGTWRRMYNSSNMQFTY